MNTYVVIRDFETEESLNYGAKPVLVSGHDTMYATQLRAASENTNRRSDHITYRSISYTEYRRIMKDE